MKCHHIPTAQRLTEQYLAFARDCAAPATPRFRPNDEEPQLALQLHALSTKKLRTHA